MCLSATFLFSGYYYQLPIIMATGECRYLVPLRGEIAV